MTSSRLSDIQEWTTHVGRQVVRALAYKLAISETDIQQRLEKHFPIQASKYMLRLTLSDPVVSLHEVRNRIAVKVNLLLELPAGFLAEGFIETDGELVFIHKQNAFFVVSPDIVALEIRPLPKQYLKPARILIRLMLTRFFAQQPIFRFDNDRLKHRLARQVVRSVEIRKGKLRVNFQLNNH